MKHITATVICIFLITTFCFAQTTETPKQNAVSFEFGKTGLIYNLNFDHRFAGRNLGLRLGAGSNFGKYLNIITTGGGGYYLLGKQNHLLELGLDLHYLVVKELSEDQRGIADIVVYPNYPTNTLYTSLNIGYRRYGQNTLFRVGLSPGIIKNEIIPGGYISYGFLF